MAANLVRRYTPELAHHLLNLSFAQYGADRDVVRLEAQLERSQQMLEAARREATCERGDVWEYRNLLRDVEDAAPAPAAVRSQVAEALERVKPGDILLLPGGKSAGRVVVLSTARRGGGEVRLGALTDSRRYLTLSARDFPARPRTIGHIDLPTPYMPRNPAFQRQVAEAMGKTGTPDGPPSARGEPPRTRRDHRVAGMVQAVEDHPVAACPDLRGHVRAAERVERLEKDARRLERRVRSRTESLARQFDRVLRVLEAWGYVEGWSLTEAGEQLARIYHECDLLVAESVRSDLLDDLDPAAVAAMASTFTYETRGPGPAPPASFPSAKLRRRWGDLERIAHELNLAEDDAGLPMTRPPDPGFADLAHSWAAGDDLAEVIADEEMSGGDFVRNVKQLIDLLRQLGDVAPEPATAKSARDAADRLFRGVVAASSVVGT
jgi:ATP-dependent RNA helicase HelY